MSRKVSNQIERVKLSTATDADYVEIRPLSGAEKLRAFSLLPQTGLMSQFIGEIQKLADKDPDNEMVKTVEKAVSEINKIEKKYNECMLDYKRFMMKVCVVKAFDDGIEQKKIHNYVEELDDEAYSEIFNKINELSFPSKEEQDFLEGEDGKSQENLKETVQ